MSNKDLVLEVLNISNKYGKDSEQVKSFIKVHDDNRFFLEMAATLSQTMISLYSRDGVLDIPDLALIEYINDCLIASNLATERHKAHQEEKK
jgi:hypothetical protein